VNQLQDRVLLLQSAGKVLLVMVSVAGRVGSDVPIPCEHSSLLGVILEEIVGTTLFEAQ
jgi:E3 ubiquitin-protein ligase MUL1